MYWRERPGFRGRLKKNRCSRRPRRRPNAEVPVPRGDVHDLAKSHFGDGRTHWSVIELAKTLAPDEAKPYWDRLALEYNVAVCRYSRQVARRLGISDAGDDVAQEVLARIVAGRCDGARQEKGLFRDYLKSTIANVARDYA